MLIRPFMFFGMMLIALCTTEHALAQPNLIVVGDDGNSGTVPCSNRVFETARATLRDQLVDEGFSTFDHSVIEVDALPNNGCGLNGKDLIDVLQTISQPPLDIAVLFSIYPLREKHENIQWISFRIQGRMINLQTGQGLGDVEVASHKREPVANSCRGNCLLESASRQIRPLVSEFAAVIATKLNNWGTKKQARATPQMIKAFELTFSNFKNDEISEVEEYLAAFEGYRSHRVASCAKRQCIYWYESNADVSRLNRNLRKMLEHLGIDGRVIQNGAAFRVERLSALK